MTFNSTTEKPFIIRILDEGPEVFLELANVTDQPLKSIEILTVFLKDEETPGGGPSQAHIRFEPIQSLQPKAKTVISHKTWINGKPAAPGQDQLSRLKNVTGETKPYVLDISWQDGEGKSRFQRIPVGH
jgi:hypothetical protein